MSGEPTRDRPGRARLLETLALVVVFTLVVGACTKSGQVESSVSTSVLTADGEEVPRPPPPAPIAPVLRRPGSPGDALAGVPTLIGGLVLAQQPIVRVELWNGSELVEATEYEEPQTELRLGWDWVAPEPGLFGLVLRAVDAEGGVATSFPLWVRVIEPAFPEGAAGVASDGSASGSDLLWRPESRQGEELRQDLPSDGLLPLFPNPGPPNISVDADSCLATVSLPAVQDAAGIAVYAASFGSAGFVPVGLLPPDGGETKFLVGASPVMVYAEAFDASQAGPGVPTVLYPPNPCMALGWAGDLSFEGGVLANPKGADRAYLYASHDGGEVWERVPGTDQQFLYPGPEGGFDFGGLLEETGSSGSFMFEAWGWVAGTLTPLGRGSWHEPDAPPPGGAGGPLEPALGELAVGPYNGPLIADSEFDWFHGYQVDPVSLQALPDQPVLTRQGTICNYTPSIPTSTVPPTIPVSIVGGTSNPTSAPPSSSQVVLKVFPESCSNYPFGQYSKKFRWTPNGTGMTHGLLQVSTKPIPNGPVVSFPGLVHTATVAKPSGKFVEFEVPLDELINPKQGTATLPDWEQMSFDMTVNLGALGGQASGNTYSFLPLPVAVGPSSRTFYLRVIPMKDTQPLIGESNEVVIEVEDEAPPAAPPVPAQPPSMSLEVRMTPPHLPNAKYERCVRVMKNPFMAFGTGLNPAPSQTPKWFQDRGQPVPAPNTFDKFYGWAQSQAFIYENGVKVHKGLVPGATVCAVQLDPPEKDWFDYVVDAVNFVAYVWDTYTMIWDKLKSWVADVVAYASGCVSIAQAAGKSKDEAEKFCSGLANTAINTALIAYGVPPTMPKFSDLVEMGKGELTDVLVKAMVDAKILDCGPLQSNCEELAKDIIDGLLDEMQTAATQAATQAATSGSQWVLSIHPGIYVIPEPASTLSPAVFEIEVTRSSNPAAPAPPASCTYTGTVWATKDHYEWQNYKTGKWQEGPVSGWIMKQESVSMDLSGMQPGESRSAVLLLTKLIDWYPEGQSPYLPTTPWHVKPQNWIFFVAYGSDAVFTKTGLQTGLNGGLACGSASQVHLQDNAGTEPWEIPTS